MTGRARERRTAYGFAAEDLTKVAVDEDLLEQLGWQVGEAHRVSRSRDRQGFVLYAGRNMGTPGSELPAAM